MKNKEKGKSFICPYDLKECDKINTSGMTKIECEKCSRYDHGIRPSKF